MITRQQISPAAIAIAIAFLKRDWRQERSYRLAFFLQFGGLLLTLAVFYFVAEFIGEAAEPLLANYGGSYFVFVLTGIGFARYFGVGLQAFARSIRQAQISGTLEAMLSTPVPLSGLLFGSVIWSYLTTTIQVLGLLLIGLWAAPGGAPESNFVAAALILGLTALVFAAIGVLAASFILVIKRGDPVSWLFNAVSVLLGGVYFPVAVLPEWLQRVARVLPITYGLEGLRRALILGEGVMAIRAELLALLIFAVTLVPFSFMAFRYAVWRARLDGSLTHY